MTTADVRALIRRGLAWHVGAYLLVLVALLLLLDPSTPFIPDESTYASQAQALDGGAWHLDLPPGSPALGDPASPLDWESDASGRPVPYARHPLYPVLLWLSSSFLGMGGAVVAISVAGAVLASAGAWRLAGSLVPGSERAAFWLTASSPMIFNALVLWAHSMGAAAVVWAIVWSVRGCRDPLARRPWIMAACCASGAALLRSEGLVVGASVAVSLAVLSGMRRNLRLGLGAVVIGCSVVGTQLVERRVVSSIVSAVGALAPRGSTETAVGFGFVDGRVHGLRRAIFSGAHYDDARDLLTSLAAALVVLGLTMVRTSPSSRRVGVAVVAAGLLVLVARVLAAPVDPVPGLFVAAPVLVLGAEAMLRFLRPTEAPERRLVGAVVALSAGGVILTQYADGGALQWGGRFFLVLVPLLAVGVPAVVTRAEHRAAAGLRASVAAAAVVPALLAVVSLHQIRAEHRDFFEEVLEEQPSAVITNFRTPGRSSAQHPDVAWILSSEDELGSHLRELADTGHERVVVAWAVEPLPSTVGWRVSEVAAASYDTLPFEVVTLTSDG